MTGLGEHGAALWWHILTIALDAETSPVAATFATWHERGFAGLGTPTTEFQRIVWEAGRLDARNALRFGAQELISATA